MRTFVDVAKELLEQGTTFSADTLTQLYYCELPLAMAIKSVACSSEEFAKEKDRRTAVVAGLTPETVASMPTDDPAFLFEAYRHVAYKYPVDPNEAKTERDLSPLVRLFKALRACEADPTTLDFFHSRAHLALAEHKAALPTEFHTALSENVWTAYRLKYGRILRDGIMLAPATCRGECSPLDDYRVFCEGIGSMRKGGRLVNGTLRPYEYPGGHRGTYLELFANHLSHDERVDAVRHVWWRYSEF